MKKLLVLLMGVIFLSGCQSDYDRFKTLESKFPNSEVFTEKSVDWYIVVTNDCSIYKVTFYPATQKINVIDRIK